MLKNTDRQEPIYRQKRELYRAVFQTDDGKKLLSHLLFDLGTFDVLESGNREQAALKSFGIMILEDLGILYEGNIERIVDKLLAVPSFEVKEEEEDFQ